MDVVHQLQQESLERREQLLDDLDIANQITHREHEVNEQERVARKQEIESQVNKDHLYRVATYTRSMHTDKNILEGVAII